MELFRGVIYELVNLRPETGEGNSVPKGYVAVFLNSHSPYHDGVSGDPEALCVVAYRTPDATLLVNS